MLDADMFAVANPDEVFALPAPGGICSTIKREQNAVWHGQRLPLALVAQSLGEWGMRGCFYLLQPNARDFAACREMLRERGEYGDLRHYLGADERLFTDYFAHHWTHVHARFGAASWKPEETMGAGVQPVFLHFVSDHPVCTDPPAL